MYGFDVGMWAYSVVCGLLLAEVNLNTLCQLGRTGATITVMAERTLGIPGSKAVGASYLFLHCAMLVACEHPQSTQSTSSPKCRVQCLAPVLGSVDIPQLPHWCVHIFEHPCPCRHS